MLGVSPAITAGAVISGAYLGDKLSPLSETTILTAQMVKVDVYEHIKRQAWTSVPGVRASRSSCSLVIGLFWHRRRPTPATPPPSSNALADIYWITPLNLLPLVLLGVLSVRKVPASLALIAVGALRRASSACSPSPTSCGPSSPARGLARSGRDQGRVAGDGHRLLDGLRHRRHRPAAVARRHGQHAAHPVADHRRGDLRRPARGVRADQPADRPDDPRGEGHRAAVPDRVRSRSGSTSSRATSTSRSSCRPGSSAPSSPGGGSRRRTSPGSPPTAARSPRRWCRGTPAAPSWARPWACPTLLYLPFCFFSIASPLLSVLYGYTGFRIEKVEPADRRGAGMTHEQAGRR